MILLMLDRLLKIRESCRQSGLSVTWTSGIFDLLHAGHVRMLQAARRHGNVLVVGVNDDASAARLKGPGRPVHPLGERIEVLAALECVSHVVAFDGDAVALLDQLRPDVFCKCSTSEPSALEAEAAVVRGYGGRVVVFPPLADISTTEILRRLQQEAESR
jgi:rfaE bifunctional protein nucleotidyltransferase chain/domain